MTAPSVHRPSSTSHQGPQRRVALLAPGARVDPPRYTGSTAGALLHGALGLLVGLALICEPSSDYQIPLWLGVADAVAPAAAVLGVHPLHLWGLVMAIPAVVVLAGVGKAWTMWPLAVLSCAWAPFAGVALYYGLTAPGAALPGGIAFLGLWLGALRACGAMGRRWKPRPRRVRRLR